MDTAIISGAELRAVGIARAPDGDYFVESWALVLILQALDWEEATLQKKGPESIARTG